MQNIFLCLGSNLDDRLVFLQSALHHIGELPKTSVLKVSSVYQSEPVGKKDQPDFLNIVVEIQSDLLPRVLLEQLKSMEARLGRKQTERWGPREIDIDILYYDNLVASEHDLTVPHSDVANRRFVLIPLAEIAPDFRDPVKNLTVSELLKSCPDQSAVQKTEFSTHLQEH